MASRVQSHHISLIKSIRYLTSLSTTNKKINKLFSCFAKDLQLRKKFYFIMVLWGEKPT